MTVESETYPAFRARVIRRSVPGGTHLRGMALVFALALAAFTGLMSQAALSPLLPFVAADVRSSVPLLAQTITVSLVVSGALALVIGPFADRFGHRRVLLISVVMVVASALLTAVANGYWTIMLARLPGGIGGGVMAAISVVLASTMFPPEHRRWAIGWTVSGISAAPILGVPGLAIIGEQFGWRASFLVLGLVGVLTGVLARAVIDSGAQVSGERFRIRDTIDAYRPLLASQVARRLQTSNILRAISWGGFLTYISAYLVDVHGMSLQVIGYVFLATGLGYFIGTRYGDGRSERFSLRSLFALSTALSGILLGGLLVVDVNFIVLLLPLIAGVSAGGMGFVTLTIMIAEESPSHPGTAMMLRQAGFSLGVAGGGALGGLALALQGYDLLGSGVIAFGIASALVTYRPAAMGDPAPMELVVDPAIDS